MRFALVVVEEHARRAMQLRHDDTLGAIDDEGAMVSHQRHFAEIDLLLTNVLDRFWRATRLLVIDDQAYLDADRRGIGQPTHLTFLDVKYGLAQSIAHVLQRCIAGIADNRKNGLKRCM